MQNSINNPINYKSVLHYYIIATRFAYNICIANSSHMIQGFFCVLSSQNNCIFYCSSCCCCWLLLTLNTRTNFPVKFIIKWSSFVGLVHVSSSCSNHNSITCPCIALTYIHTHTFKPESMMCMIAYYCTFHMKKRVTASSLHITCYWCAIWSFLRLYAVFQV